jgi:hypothetical protein
LGPIGTNTGIRAFIAILCKLLPFQPVRIRLSKKVRRNQLSLIVLVRAMESAVFSIAHQVRRLRKVNNPAKPTMVSRPIIEATVWFAISMPRRTSPK